MKKLSNWLVSDMPNLDLSGYPLELKLLNITALMCFPSEKEQNTRRYWILKQLLGFSADQYNDLVAKHPPGERARISEYIGSWLGEAISNLGSWPGLADATIGPGQKRSVTKETIDIFYKGIILGLVFKIALRDRQGISRSASNYYDEEACALGNLGCEPRVQDPGYITRTLWPRFKNAAHLWAALIKIGRVENKTRFFPLDKFEPGGLTGFLRYADALSLEGTSIIPSRGPRKTLLDPETIWHISI